MNKISLMFILFRESYHELMTLARKINPSLQFIHHSEENARDPEAKKEERRMAAAEAFKRTFGKECEWFKEHQEDTEIEDSEEDEGGMLIFIKAWTGRIFPLAVYPDDDIRTVNNLIAVKEGIPRDQQRLKFDGRQIFAGETLAGHHIENEDMLELTLRLRGC